MKAKTKKIVVPFILMLVFNLSIYSIFNLNFGEGVHPHVGIIFISGLLFGPYGAAGASIGNLICDLFRGYPPLISLSSFIVTFGVSFFGYKLWYESFKSRPAVTQPKLNNTIQFVFFLAIIVLCASLYSVLHQKIFLVLSPNLNELIYTIGLRYWLNFFTSSFIMGIIGIWISERIDFVDIPEKIENRINKKFYIIVGSLLLFSIIIVAITDYLFDLNQNILIAESIAIVILLYVYLTKPLVNEVKRITSRSISENIMNIFLLALLLILIFGYVLTSDSQLIDSVLKNLPIQTYELENDVMLFVNTIMVLYLIPSLAVLRYIEKKVVEPIVKFSQIEGIIKQGDKIESKSLIKTYGEYSHEENEVGDLARSYTELIYYNNNYIENIKEIEGERERIKTELDIAEKIQKANLPTETIEEEDYLVYGYSKPAKEVGGDFFDHYKLDDENIALVIGDASGKGIPAALLSSITQNLIKHLFTETRDPSKILKSLNNQLCENNPQAMFITLWLGIYNKNTDKITYSNAGHNPPLIYANGTFKELDLDKGIVIGVLEDFEYETEETYISKGMILYTDGITDANNNNGELYGEDRLIEFLNNHNFNENMINAVLENINEFTGDADQFDDMTMLMVVKK